MLTFETANSRDCVASHYAIKDGCCVALLRLMGNGWVRIEQSGDLTTAELREIADFIDKQRQAQHPNEG